MKHQPYASEEYHITSSRASNLELPGDFSAFSKSYVWRRVVLKCSYFCAESKCRSMRHSSIAVPWGSTTTQHKWHLKHLNLLCYRTTLIDMKPKLFQNYITHLDVATFWMRNYVKPPRSRDYLEIVHAPKFRKLETTVKKDASYMQHVLVIERAPFTLTYDLTLDTVVQIIKM